MNHYMNGHTYIDNARLCIHFDFPRNPFVMTIGNTQLVYPNRLKTLPMFNVVTDGIKLRMQCMFLINVLTKARNRLNIYDLYFHAKFT